MKNLIIEIRPYDDSFREQLLFVWEKSVLATHSFLSKDDFISIREIVHTLDFNNFDVYCLTQEYKVIGFLGLLEKKVEMLFLDPNHFGQGLGKKLMDFAINQLKANKVDVNEQNSMAVKFYEKLGFATYERSEKDDHGKNYPLLRMKLVSQNI